MEKTEGIVLKVIPYGETNKIVTLLTSKYGKIGVLAKGANKPQSRLASVSQPFTHGQWLLFGGNSGMASVSQADLVNSFRVIREDLYRTAYASCMTELTDRILTEREPFTGVFRLLLSLLEQLAEGKDPAVLLNIYETKILLAAGIQPDLYHCANCRKTLDHAKRFSVGMGGPLCDACLEIEPYAVRLQPATLKLLQLFQSIAPDRIGNIRVTVDVKRQITKILRQYLEEHTGIFLKSRQFLDQLDKYQL